MFEESISKSGGSYRAKFVTLGTNDTDLYELTSISSLRAQWLAIKQHGYYVAYFLVSTGVTLWGANYTNLEPIWNDGGGDSTFGTGGDSYSDFIFGSNRILEQFPNEAQASSPDHHTLVAWTSFNYSPGTQANWEAMSPLEIAVRVTSDKTGAMPLFAQVHVRRIASTGGYTLIDLEA